MKPIVLVLSLFAAVAAGAVGGIVASPTTNPTEVAAVAGSTGARGSEATTNRAPALVDNSDVQKQLADLSNEVARLQAEILALREGRVRADATETALAAPTEEIPAGSLAIIHEDAIRRVIAKDRAELQQQEEDARKQRELENAMQRAERIAKELGMSTAEQQKLAEVYVMERDKREEFRKNFQEGVTPDRDQMRQTFQEYRDWRTGELTSRFGADLTGKINEFEGDRGNFGMRMMGPDGGGGAAFGTGGGGGNGGARQRRNNNGNNGGNNNQGGGPPGGG